MSDQPNFVPESAFEVALAAALGAGICESDDNAQAMWSALANIIWTHSDGTEAAYTFRDAGSLIASIRGRGTHMDWYCSGPYAQVSEHIAATMAGAGWTPSHYPPDPDETDVHLVGEDGRMASHRIGAVTGPK